MFIALHNFAFDIIPCWDVEGMNVVSKATDFYELMTQESANVNVSKHSFILHLDGCIFFFFWHDTRLRNGYVFQPSQGSVGYIGAWSIDLNESLFDLDVKV